MIDLLPLPATPSALTAAAMRETSAPVPMGHLGAVLSGAEQSASRTVTVDVMNQYDGRESGGASDRREQERGRAHVDAPSGRGRGRGDPGDGRCTGATAGRAKIDVYSRQEL